MTAAGTLPLPCPGQECLIFKPQVQPNNTFFYKKEVTGVTVGV